MASVDFGSKRIAPPASPGEFGSRHPPQGGRQATQADCGAIDTVLLNGETVDGSLDVITPWHSL